MGRNAHFRMLALMTAWSFLALLPQRMEAAPGGTWGAVVPSASRSSTITTLKSLTPVSKIGLPTSATKPVTIPAQPTLANFSKVYFGSPADLGGFSSVDITSDGGMIVPAGWFLMKLSVSGGVLWQKETAQGGIVRVARDGGFFEASERNESYLPSDSDPGTGGPVNGMSVSIRKTDANGNELWEKTFYQEDAPNPPHELINSMEPTPDGAFVISGSSGSGKAIGAWILKMDADGTILWQKNYKLNGHGLLNGKVQVSSDGGYIGGASYSDVAGVVLWKLDANGDVLWHRVFDGVDCVEGMSALSTQDGGTLFVGSTPSFGAGGFDLWVIKLDANGNVLWQKAYGGKNDDKGVAVQSDSDGGFFVGGTTASFGAGQTDLWILKFDGNGNILWQKTYGGSYDDQLSSLRVTSAGTLIAVGSTRSFGNDPYHIKYSPWILDLDHDGNAHQECAGVGVDSAAQAMSTAAVPSEPGLLVTNNYLTKISECTSPSSLCYFGTNDGESISSATACLAIYQ